MLIGHESPVRDRLVADLRELEGVAVVVQEPGAGDIRATLLSVHPGAVLVDIQQAQAGGVRLIRAIRGLDTDPLPVIIALSSSTSVQYRMECRDAGATFFFDIAGDQESLARAVQSIRDDVECRPA